MRPSQILLVRAAALVTLSLSLLTGCAAPTATLPTDARALLARVQAGGPYPRTVHFVQEATSYLPDGGVSSQFMEEWASLPGKLRIDVTSPAPATLLFSDEKVVRIDDHGRSERPGPNLALVLMLDVLVQEPGAWLQRAEAFGLDTSLLSLQSWNGQACFVLGALPGDTASTQVWFEATRARPVRYLETSGRAGSQRLTEGRALDYREFDAHWMHTRFEFLTDGNMTLLEIYRDVVVNLVLGDDHFDADVVAHGFND